MWTVRTLSSFRGARNTGSPAAGGSADSSKSLGADEEVHKHRACAPPSGPPPSRRAATEEQNEHTRRRHNPEGYADKFERKRVTSDDCTTASGRPEAAVTDGFPQSTSRLLHQLSDGEVVDTGFGGSRQLLVAITSPPPPQLLQELVCASPPAAVPARPLDERAPESAVGKVGAALSHASSTATLPTLPAVPIFGSGDFNVPATPGAWSPQQQLSTQVASSQQPYEIATSRFAEARNVATEKPSTPSEAGSSDQSSFVLRPLSRRTLCVLSPTVAQPNQSSGCAMQFPSLVFPPPRFLVKQSPKARDCSRAVAGDHDQGGSCRQREPALVEDESTKPQRKTPDDPPSACVQREQTHRNQNLVHEHQVPGQHESSDCDSTQQPQGLPLRPPSIPQELVQQPTFRPKEPPRQPPQQQPLLHTFQEALVQHWLTHLPHQGCLQYMDRQATMHVHQKAMRPQSPGTSLLSHELAHESMLEASPQRLTHELSETRLHLGCSGELTTQQPALKEPLLHSPQLPKLRSSSQLLEPPPLGQQLQQQGQDRALCPPPPVQPQYCLNQQRPHHEASNRRLRLQDEALENRHAAESWGQLKQSDEGSVAASFLQAQCRGLLCMSASKETLVEILEALHSTGHLTLEELQALVLTVAQESGNETWYLQQQLSLTAPAPHSVSRLNRYFFVTGEEVVLPLLCDWWNPFLTARALHGFTLFARADKQCFEPSSVSSRPADVLGSSRNTFGRLLLKGGCVCVRIRVSGGSLSGANVYGFEEFTFLALGRLGAAAATQARGVDSGVDDAW
ncbi:hypothetical protein ACSSS7_003153 [Eimeria intestinalis]